MPISSVQGRAGEALSDQSVRGVTQGWMSSAAATRGGPSSFAMAATERELDGGTGSLELTANARDTRHPTIPDGREFARNSKMDILGVAVDACNL